MDYDSIILIHRFENMIMHKDTTEFPYGHATAFFIDDKHAITNHHVIRSTSKIIGDNWNHSVKNILFKIIAFNVENDWAVIECISDYKPKTVFPIGDSDKLILGEQLHSYGFSLDWKMKYLKGDLIAFDRQYLVTDMNIIGGQSGSLVLNSNKEIVALVSFGAMESSRNSNINNYLVSINCIPIKKILTKKHQLYIHVPRYSFNYQNLPLCVKDYLGIPKDQEGLLMDSNKIITSINGYKIVNNMIQMTPTNYITLDTYRNYLLLQTTVVLEIFDIRKKQINKVSYNLNVDTDVNTISSDKLHHFQRKMRQKSQNLKSYENYPYKRFLSENG